MVFQLMPAAGGISRAAQKALALIRATTPAAGDQTLAAARAGLTRFKRRCRNGRKHGARRVAATTCLQPGDMLLAGTATGREPQPLDILQQLRHFALAEDGVPE